MRFLSGSWRVDVLALIGYQLCQYFSVQQLYPILLNYVPPVKCIDDHCFKVTAKCYADCPDCADVCSNSSLIGEDLCRANNRPYFYSAAMEYEQFCDSFYKAFSSSTVQYLGVLLGNCFVGFFADKYGRRKVILIALSLGIPNLVLSGVVMKLHFYYMFRFLLGISVSATQCIGWAYFAEMISPKHRFKLRTFTSWTNARLLMTAVTHLAMTWRLATYYHAILSLLPLALVYFLPESPLWLKRKGYLKEEERARRRLAWINGMEYKKVVNAEEKEKIVQHPQVSLSHVLTDAELRSSFLVLCVMWFCAGLSMYMIDLNGEDMTKNFWVGQYMSAALASIVRVIVGFADAYLPWLGRRKVYILSMGICIIASAGLLIQLLSGAKGSTLYFITYLTAYNSISVSMEPNYLGAAELMPTDVRGKTTAMLNIITRVGTVLASQMIYFKTFFEPAIMIVLIISNLSGFLVVTRWLKETKNISLEGVGHNFKANDVDIEAPTSRRLTSDGHSGSVRIRDVQKEKEQA
ncbi:unnamed protein product [Cylicocyclus nassatus]|uniref:Major facilitator superfamily (MFS) profile domain-containing protein n=1 Tax=Cylicocyclus nassatus TaxID=53992 RepID=A0AA36M7H7_CYLNA|nr:unnamed protein product [Cylicocyclus nassatus]